MDTGSSISGSVQERITATAAEYFNISGVLPFQHLVISNILEGYQVSDDDAEEHCFHRQIVLLPTGMGKSLCFMLPGILMEGITLIIFPLLSLMADQKRRLREAGLHAMILRGGEARSAQEAGLHQRGLQFILTNPEMLQQQWVMDILKALPIAHAVIDEAHTVSQWGESFRPAYRQVGTLLRNLQVRQITAFTATASLPILRNIRKWVFLDRPVHLISATPDRPNISYRAVPTISPIHDITRLLNPLSGISRPVIVFCARRATTEYLFRIMRIRLQEDEILYYHAGLSKEDRSVVEERFHASSDGILFATSAYGMGIDKKNIRSVLHFDLSSSVEAYLQETGRAGRDTLPATAIALIPLGRETGNPLLSIFNQHTACWRKLLLQTLNSTVEYCPGCDVCDRTIQKEPEGLREIITLIRRNRLKLTRSQAARILCGRYSHAVIRQKLHTRRGFSALSTWELDDIEDAISTLLSSSVLHASNLLLWRNLLRTTVP